ncbi:hypothetical protein DEU56DRAFT_905594, partial [Suillus clintonianus]|uniref:uncharacterized protein n=1 Tax=Suillus clintonianus TaxID=1904413 RepID=UPI001B87AFA6
MAALRTQYAHLPAIREDSRTYAHQIAVWPGGGAIHYFELRVDYRLVFAVLRHSRFADKLHQALKRDCWIESDADKVVQDSPEWVLINPDPVWEVGESITERQAAYSSRLCFRVVAPFGYWMAVSGGRLHYGTRPVALAGSASMPVRVLLSDWLEIHATINLASHFQTRQGPNFVGPMPKSMDEFSPRRHERFMAHAVYTNCGEEVFRKLVDSPKISRYHEVPKIVSRPYVVTLRIGYELINVFIIVDEYTDIENAAVTMVGIVIDALMPYTILLRRDQKANAPSVKSYDS